MPSLAVDWPDDQEALEREQAGLAAAAPEPWRPGDTPAVAGCFVCFPRGTGGTGARGEPGWAAAAIGADGPVAVVRGTAGAPYGAGRLALREGALLEAAVRALDARPDVLLVDATGRDHPRRAGLATHLGAIVDLPTVGVTHRPLLAHGDWPAEERGAHAPLVLDGETVGAWLRVAARRRPLAVHAAWRTDVDTAIAVVLGATPRVRTPEPLRRARRAARRTRSGDGG
jgi:deoxyribonuclease V